jgi:hypothetical protein
MTYYLVSAKIKQGVAAEIRERIVDGSFINMKPFGKTLTRAMFQIRQDPVSGKVYWEEECHCSPPLAMERTAVLDQYFTEINAEQSSEDEGWAQISDLPVLWDEIHKPFLKILHQADKNGWCQKPWCTTCGAQDFRTTLEIGILDGSLIDPLANMNIDDLVALPNWDNALLVTWMDLRFSDSDQWEYLLKSWLDIPNPNTMDSIHHPSLSRTLYKCTDQYSFIRFCDFVLYKLVRPLSKNRSIREQWINKCIELAVETRLFSLTESVLLTLREEASEHEELVNIAKLHAEDEWQEPTQKQQMKRVLRNACGIEL